MAEKALDKSYYGDSKMAQWGVADDQLTMGRKWLTFFIVFAFGACCVHQYQMVSPILTQIGEVFGMGLDSVGMIMTVFAFTGIVLTFPAMWIMQKIGIKSSLVITGVLAVVGDVVALLATDTFVFLAARVIQGCAFAMIAVMGPNLMPRLFPSKSIGLVMGIWGVWFTVGVMLSTIFTPMLYAAMGWQGCFIFSIALMAVTTALVALFFKMPRVPESIVEHGTDQELKEAARIGSGRKNYVKSAIVVGLSFLAFEIVYMTWSAFYPTYGQTVQMMSIADSALVPLVVTLVTVPFSVVSGIVTDKLVRAKELLIGAYVLLFVLCAFCLWNGAENPLLMWVSNIVYAALVVSSIPVTTRFLITYEAQTPKATDLALTCMTLCTSLGGFFGVFFGMIVDASGWGFGGMVLSAVSVVGVAVLLFVKGDHAIMREQGKVEDKVVIEEAPVQ